MNSIEILKKLKLANEAYARGFPFLTDAKYDLLWAQLYAIEPNNPHLYHTANSNNISSTLSSHKYQIFGTNKAFSMEDLKPYFARFGHTELLLQPKYDGCAVMVYKQKHNTFKILLEGDGVSGRDITHHAKHFHFNKNTMSSVESMEAIIHMSDWEESYGANPRNTVAGWINRDKFPDVTIHLVKHNNSLREKEYFFDGNFEFLSEHLLSLYYNWSKSYPLDGIMIKVKDEELRLRSGNNGKAYAWSIAWKPPIQTAETVVTDIELNVSRRGRIVPTIIYEEVKLCGTNNTRVTGNNITWLQDRLINIGTKITVGKAGEIIPKIVNALEGKSKMNTPTRCPICNTILTYKKSDLYCEGTRCLPQLVKKLAYFYSDKGIGLKSIGTSMFERLLKNPIIYKVLRKHPYALLDLNSYNLIAVSRIIFGPTLFAKYKKALEDINGKKNVIDFITSLGHDKLGRKNVTNIYHYLQGQPLRRNVNRDLIDNFAISLQTFYKVQDKFVSFKFTKPPKPPVMTFCITGTLTVSRDDMIQYLAKYQWEYTNQVSKYTDFLIIGEKPGAVKANKAEYMSVPTIKEDEIVNYISKEG